jgi:flagellar basal-body rod protein FlgG
LNQGIYPLAATMINQLNRVDVLANNLANSNTNAFKQDHLVEGSFNNYLKKAQKKDEPISKLNTTINTIPKIDGHFFNQTLGAIIPTNNQLDFAIKDENTFFKIKNPNTNEIVLTKDGAFDIMNDHLVTKNGWDVLNINNAPIFTTENDFSKDIAVVKTDFSNLQKQGNNNYRIKSQQNIKELIDNKEYVLQGALEKSNINSILSMVGLIDSQRRFEQAQKAITGIDDINQKVINKIGSGR